jgi:hypothetical protein
MKVYISVTKRASIPLAPYMIDIIYFLRYWGLIKNMCEANPLHMSFGDFYLVYSTVYWNNFVVDRIHQKSVDLIENLKKIEVKHVIRINWHHLNLVHTCPK